MKLLRSILITRLFQHTVPHPRPLIIHAPLIWVCQQARKQMSRYRKCDPSLRQPDGP